MRQHAQSVLRSLVPLFVSAVPVVAQPAAWPERLGRAVVSVRVGEGNLVTWRLFASDAEQTAFHVQRDGERITDRPVTGACNLLDGRAAATAVYTVTPVIDGREGAASRPSRRFAAGYWDVPLDVPPAGADCTYLPNDASVGDLDGDGEYELVMKWNPSNAKDNSQTGRTGPVLLDAYTLDGERLWRIDLGRNVRAGAHYTQFQVFDYDGDGRAEVACRTCDGSVDGAGVAIGDAEADHRDERGYVLAGPEFVTVFDGRTGRALATAPFVPERGDVRAWGDDYGNRVDRFLAGTAFVDGERPSLVFGRGYYTRTVVTAWDFRDGALRRRWTFDSDDDGNAGFAGQGAHSLAIADVDGDGRDEIVYGAMVVDDDGTGLWSTGFGHGDAEHVADHDPARPGLEVFMVSEGRRQPSSWFADAATGEVLWRTEPNGDNGRGVAADIWAGSPGAEFWSARERGMRDVRGEVVGRRPRSCNFVVWWDGDVQRELLDREHIDDYTPDGDVRLLTAEGVRACNGTKATPALACDLLGDWREEVVWPTRDGTALRIYSTPHHTDVRWPTLMHDRQYRCAIAWQNTGYNQPPHPSRSPADR